MNRHDDSTVPDKLTYLREVDIFQDLTTEEIVKLGTHTPMKRVDAGTMLSSPDQPNEVLFILKEGRVRLYHLQPDGRMLTVAVLEAGAIFGEMVLLGQNLQGSYAEAVTPCLLCLMSRHDVKALLLGDPRIAFRIAETLGRRLIETEHRLLDIAFKRVPERLAVLLVQYAHPTPAGLFSRRLEVNCTHEELADLAGTYRETVTKVLSDFRSQGLIELQRGKIILLNAGELRKLGKIDP
ncbi:MAG: Crp/Fnr family transcriptional regulator [Chloroflexi bacterium]|nr:Crp/Fnr family transcriptional regulator [Chloroflexota bacterium]